MQSVTSAPRPCETISNPNQKKNGTTGRTPAAPKKVTVMTTVATDIKPRLETGTIERYGMAVTLSHYISDLLETIESYTSAEWMNESEAGEAKELSAALERAQRHWVSVMMEASP